MIHRLSALLAVQSIDNTISSELKTGLLGYHCYNYYVIEIIYA